MKTTSLLALCAKLILGGSLLLSFCLCPGGPAAAQQLALADNPARTAPDFAHLQAAITHLPDTSRIKQLREFGDAMLDVDKPEQARLAFQEAATLAQPLPDKVWLSRALGSLGYLAALQADYPTAINHYLRALDLVKNTTAYSQQARMLLRLGITYMQAQDLAKAGRYLRQSLMLSQQQHLLHDEAYAYNSLSNWADIKHQPAQALAYSQRSRDIYRTLKDWSSYHTALLNLGIMYKNAGRYAESEQAYRETLQYAEAQHDHYMAGYVYSNFPNTLLLLKRPAEAEHYVQLGIAWARHSPDRVAMLHELYDELTRIKEQQRDYQAALTYSRLTAAYQDTLLNKEKSKQLVEAETRHQTAQQQARIAQLATQNTQRLRQLGALALGSALLLGLLGIAVGQYRTIRRKNAQLEATNQTITDNSQRLGEQSRRLTLLIRELHHRVKNNLAIISSLLRLQSDRLQDERAARAVREGQQRVEAMSLIHQRLYQTDNVTTVDMQLYITDLAQSLMTAYGYRSNTFDLTIEVEQPTLDVDVAVPLGLILNELLTNSFKYAYDSNPHPTLRIRLAGGTPTDDLELNVRDNGPGIDPVQWQRPGGSFGKRLIASLSEQVGGHMTMQSEGGAHYRLLIPVQALLQTA